jgi:ribonucleoside-diphosphate reductase alpha chain
MGSMRMLATAGTALDRDNAAGFNCSYMVVNRPQAFDEALYLLACGTGVGYSVERQYIRQLPEVPDSLYPSDTVIVVPDSKIGWASSLRQLIHLLYSGVVPKWDVSRVRGPGERLKTFGGRSSGPGPLEDLFRYVINTFKEAVGRRLYSIECHGIMCMIGDAIIVGGVRRSALICLFNPSDDRMLTAKTGEWANLHPEYQNANNSAVWTEKPSMERFLTRWLALVMSKNGEPGIVNREGMRKLVARNGRRDPNYEFGTNPCAEIVLRDREMCNLSEVVVRPSDTYDDLARKVRLATVLGTIQSTFTNFRYLSSQWKKNCDEERLLGVSLTGIMGHPVLSGVIHPGDYGAFVNGRGPTLTSLESVLESLRQVSIETNEDMSAKLGITPSVAISCIKPSGNNSQLCLCSAGIHTWHSKFYVRTIRLSKLDPVAQLLREQGVPHEDELAHPDNTWVFSYPIKAPEGSITREDVTALDQLELWLTYAKYWCEHKPSITVSVREDEWLKTGAFVFDEFDQMSGVSFLPYSGHSYHQAPYQEVTEEEYEKLLAQMPKTFDWNNLQKFEKEDGTTSSREFACTSNACEVM